MITKITTIPKAILVLLYLVDVNESFFTSDAVCISSLDDMAGDYYFPHAAIKLQPTKNFSFGLICQSQKSANDFTKPKHPNKIAIINTSIIASFLLDLLFYVIKNSSNS